MNSELLDIAFEMCLLPLAAVIVFILSFYYFMCFVKKEKRVKIDYIGCMMSIICITLAVSQIIANLNLYNASRALLANSNTKIDSDVIPYYINAGKTSPIIIFKARMYEYASNLYETANTKEDFDKNKLYEYITMAAKYNKMNYASLLNSSLMYEDYDISEQAAKELNSDYYIAKSLILKKEYLKALPYIERSLGNCKGKQCFNYYIAKAIIFKNLGGDEIAEENFNLARASTKDSKAIAKLDSAIENYETFYEDEEKANKESHVEIYGY